MMALNLLCNGTLGNNSLTLQALAWLALLGDNKIVTKGLIKEKRKAKYISSCL